MHDRAFWGTLLSKPPCPVTEVGLQAADGGAHSGGGMPSEHASGTSVPTIHASELTYHQFCTDFMERNLPVVIKGVTEGWQAAQDWVTPDGGINLDFLERHFGAARVMATDTARAHKGSGPCQEMSLQQYLHWWRRHKEAEASETRQAPVQTSGGSDVQEAAGTPGSAALWYCKDWHLASEFRWYRAYTCPPFFLDDWMNEWYDSQPASQQRQHACHQQQPQQRDCSQHEEQQPEAPEGPEARADCGSPGRGAGDPQPGMPPSEAPQQEVTTADYRFVYIGPKGTSTPLHADVLRSFSWSANVAGRKRWRLLRPQLSHLLLDRCGHSVAWDFEAEDGEGLYPGLAEARRHTITVLQQPGDAIFVPSGWFHTVENLDDCASINHNWLNGHNAHWAWALLRQERCQAEQGIEDCRQLCSPAEFEGLVQRNLAANAGLDYAGWGALVRCIARRSLASLRGCAGERASGGRTQQERSSVMQPADGEGGLQSGSQGWQSAPQYHAFRLQRAALVLRELVAEQQEIDGACTRLQPAEVPPHAAEVAASQACLLQIEQQLGELVIDVL